MDNLDPKNKELLARAEMWKAIAALCKEALTFIQREVAKKELDDRYVSLNKGQR